MKPPFIIRICILLALCTVYLCGCRNRNASGTTPPAHNGTVVVVLDQPAQLSWDIVRILPHDPAAFTEGLEFKDGYLYESTGEYGYSELRKVDPATGKVVQFVKLESRFFGEGITIIGDKVYQLTYREGTGFVYDLKTLKKTGSFAIHTTEGWGMTHNASQMIYDDGSNVLHFIDPASGKEVKTLQVTDGNGRVTEVNELEMIKGFIYANVWKQDVILKIDTTTGKVVARADMGELRRRVGIPETASRRGDPEVMNGIAYDTAGNRIFITGKYWPKLIEVRLGD